MEKNVLFLTTQVDLVREFEKDILKGAHADIAKSEAAANSYLDLRPTPFNLVVIDENLPSTDCGQLLVTIHLLHPGLPVIGLGFREESWPVTSGPFTFVRKQRRDDLTPIWPFDEMVNALNRYEVATI